MEEAIVAVKFIGDVGIEIVCIVDDGVADTLTEVVRGVADAVFDGPVEPILRFAVTTNEYVLSVSRLLIM